MNRVAHHLHVRGRIVPEILLTHRLRLERIWARPPELGGYGNILLKVRGGSRVFRGEYGIPLSALLERAIALRIRHLSGCESIALGGASAFSLPSPAARE